MRTSFLAKIVILLGLLLFKIAVLQADEGGHTLLTKERVEAANDFYQKHIATSNKVSSTKLERLERKVNAKQAFDSHDWYASRYAFQRVLADDENDFKAWFFLCRSFIELQHFDTYQNYDEALEASLVKAYVKATSNLDKKAVEWLAGSSRLALEPLKQNALKDSSQAQIEEHITSLSKNYPAEFAPYSLDIPERTDIASACVLWTYPLVKSPQFHYEDYISITPKVKDLSVIARKNQLCLEGLSFGQNYQLTFKAGFPGEENIKLSQAQTLDIFIAHRKPAISFREKGYILASHAPQLVPLSAVNVSEVKLKLIHVPERNIHSIQLNWFANSISRWEADYLQEEQGSLVWEGTYKFPVTTDKTTVSGLPIEQIIGHKLEPGVYVIEAKISDKGYDENAFTSQALVISDIGISTYQGPDGLHVIARSYKTAKPLADVEINLIAKNNRELGKIKTNTDGKALFSEKMINGKGGNSPAYLSATLKGKEFTVLNLKNEAFDLTDRGNTGKEVNNAIEGFISTERGIYRPGETVHLFSLLRTNQGKATASLPLTLKLFRPDGVLAQSLTLTDKGNGAYFYDYPIQPTAQSGLWTAAIYLDPKAEQINHVAFEVNDFVPPRIEVKTQAANKQITSKQESTIDVSAQYYYGPPGADLKVQAQSTLIPCDEPFSQWKAYHFGLVEENWTPQRFTHPDTKTDAQGKAHVTLHVDAEPQTSKALTLETAIEVFEVGGRPRKVKHKTLFWHQPYLIGIAPRFKDNMAASNSKAVFDIIAVNKDGALQNAAGLQYTLFEEHHDYVWFRQGTNWQYEIVSRDNVVTTGHVTLANNAPTELSIPVKYGAYRVEVLDKKTGVTSSVRFCAGWYASEQSPDRPDMLEVGFGDKATSHNNKVKVHVKSPFAGELFLAWAGNTFNPIYQGKIGNEATTLEIPLHNLENGGQYLIAQVFSGFDQKIEQMPKRAIGIAWLDNHQTALKHRLDFNIEHPEKIQSGQQVNITLRTQKPSKDLHYLVALVDEGTLSLTQYPSPNPYDFFYAQKKLSYELRDSYGLLINPFGGRPGSFEVGGGESIMSRALTQLPARAFKVVSLYSGVIDSKGKDNVTIPFSIPEYTGKLRVMAIAWNEQGVGANESTLLVQDPLDIYLASPRFLAPSDKTTVPLIIKAIDVKDGQYTLRFTSDGQEQKHQFNLKKGEEQHIPITLQFNDNGIKKLAVTLTGPNAFEQKRQFELSVRPKYGHFSLTQYHTLAPSQSFQLTPELLNNFQANNSLVSLSIGSLPELASQTHINDLMQYPYYCLEQTTSKLLATLLSAKPDPELLEKGFNQLNTLQKMDGSFSLWPQNATEPWLSLYAYDVLMLAKAKGYAPPSALMTNAARWLTEAKDRTIHDADDIAIAAYAHYLLAKEHQGSLGQLRYFTQNHQKEITARHDMAFIAAAFAYYDSPTDAAIWFKKAIQAKEASKENYYAGFGSPLRNSAILVTLLSQTTHEHAELIRLTQELVDKSKEAVYLSTQEKAWLINASMALKDARKKYHLTLDDKTIEGVMPQSFDFAINALQKNPVIKNTSLAPVYFALTMHGEPKEVKSLAQASFEIKRQVYNLQGENVDLTKLKSGELYIIELKGRRLNDKLNHVLLVDRLPAGIEIDNAKLSQELPEQLAWLGNLTYTDRIEGRDDHFMAAFNLWEQSEFKVAYIARAVSQGNFVYPATFVQAMYQPSFFAYGDEQPIQVISP
ncbi:MAG: alpha-2-macroglobulin family protein [Proteobacteria bacterium]|nr:alpha-2-macroglobulin family protein [Pseudomonadota bacterium]